MWPLERMNRSRSGSSTFSGVTFEHGPVERGEDVDRGEVAADVAGSGVVDQLQVLDPDLPRGLGDRARSARRDAHVASRPKDRHGGVLGSSEQSCIRTYGRRAIELSSTFWTSRWAASAS